MTFLLPTAPVVAIATSTWRDSKSGNKFQNIFAEKFRESLEKNYEQSSFVVNVFSITLSFEDVQDPIGNKVYFLNADDDVMG